MDESETKIEAAQDAAAAATSPVEIESLRLENERLSQELTAEREMSAAQLESLKLENERLTTKIGELRNHDGFAVIELRRDAMVGDVKREAGEVIGIVKTAPGCSLNYLFDAFRDGIAGERKNPV